MKKDTISRRDFIAATVLPELIRLNSHREYAEDKIIASAYSFADRMIEYADNQRGKNDKS